jgi:hypothetical protein
MSLLSEHFSEDPVNLAVPLRELKLGVERSASSRAGIIRAGRALETVRTDAERAGISLDLYRRMVESQLRPWVRALLRIRGRQVSKVAPLNTLREQLIKDGLPLLRDAADAILPAARNAGAHEDFEWDDAARILRIGDAAVTVGELEDATERAYAFMCGAEAAWSCARARWPQLATLLDSEDPPGGLRTMNTFGALAHFGTNGLRVADWRYERGKFAVTVDELPSQLINPCFQAVTWASRYLADASRFEVLLPGLSRAALELTRPALDATFFVGGRRVCISLRCRLARSFQPTPRPAYKSSCPTPVRWPPLG